MSQRAPEVFLNENNNRNQNQSPVTNHIRQKSNCRVYTLVAVLFFILGLLTYLFYLLYVTHTRNQLKASMPEQTNPEVFENISYEKKEFLKKYGDLYGYHGRIDEIRKTQTPHLKGNVYVDYTGSGIFQKKQIEEFYKMVTSKLYGNTHSVNPSSRNTDEIIKGIRKRVLDFFYADPNEYSIIFTSGTTGSLKIVGESFPWTKDSEFIYTRSNHNSVLGIREYALHKGASFDCVDISSLLNEAEVRTKEGLPRMTSGTDTSYHLFAFPAECNYSGMKFNLDLIELFHNKTLGMRRGEYFVLLDAAAFVPTSPLNLTKYKPDFVTISFYKMMGYPTGLGALIIKNTVAPLLQKTFFSGGTVSLSLSDDAFFQWMPELCTRFEDGTLNFLSIAALSQGLDALEDVGGMEEIKRHCHSLMVYVFEEMEKTKHNNGKKLFELYGNHETRDPDKQGAIFNFNLLDSNGEYFGFFDISMLAAEEGISFRTGCSCNPGACYDFLRVPKQLIKDTVANIPNNSCGERLDIVSGYPIGSIRISFGYLSTFEDAYAVLEFFKGHFLNKTQQQFMDELALRDAGSD